MGCGGGVGGLERGLGVLGGGSQGGFGSGDVVSVAGCSCGGQGLLSGLDLVGGVGFLGACVGEGLGGLGGGLLGCGKGLSGVGGLGA